MDEDIYIFSNRMLTTWRGSGAEIIAVMGRRPVDFFFFLFFFFFFGGGGVNEKPKVYKAIHEQLL